MSTVAFYTLGCKVNQYDSQAMLEQFLKSGYEARGFHERADVYVINSCVVTGTGEKKSLQAVRRAMKLNPQAEVILAGCLAQKDAEGLLARGLRLVIGNQRRAEVVTLLNEAVANETQIAAVDSVLRIPFEKMEIANFDGHTRAVMKVQEGCDRYCAYCIIPYVRGGIRSRAVEDAREEALRLADAGYSEVVLTGIHLSSYGRDLEDGSSLLDVIEAVAQAQGIQRIRLGSLEPVVATEAFVQGLARITKICPQFHLSLQSGNDRVLKSMRRRYSTAEYLEAARRLQAAFPGCSLTTDVITGFPGESEEEFADTLAFCREVGFARIHVFPYSKREGTPAADMPGQLPKAVKEERARRLIALADELAQEYRRQLLDTLQSVLFEEEDEAGASGYTPQYVEVWAKGAKQGQLAQVRLHTLGQERFEGLLV